MRTLLQRIIGFIYVGTFIGAILLVLFVLFSPSLANARMNLMVMGGGVGAAEVSYDFMWDGDHPSGESYAYIESGDSSDAWDTTDGTDRVSDAIGSDGDQELEITDLNQYIRWNAVYIDDEIGTIWFSIYSAATLTAEMAIFESYVDSTDNLYARLKTNDRIKGSHEGNGNQQDLDNAAAVIDTTTHPDTRTFLCSQIIQVE